MLAPLPCKIGAKVSKGEIIRTINDCEVDTVAAIFAFARAGKTGWAAPDCLD